MILRTFDLSKNLFIKSFYIKDKFIICAFFTKTMENESPQQLYNISEMYQLCKHQKKCYEGEPDKKVCSFMGIIIDCSNYVAGYQKIFIIDDSIQKNPLIIFLRGESNESFITNAKIGDVVFFKYFQVGFYEE